MNFNELKQKYSAIYNDPENKKFLNWRIPNTGKKFNSKEWEKSLDQTVKDITPKLIDAIENIGNENS